QLTPAGPQMTIFPSSDDDGFEVQAAVPLAAPPKARLSSGLAIGEAPEGRALKFVHRGPYETIEKTYDTIAHYVDDKQIAVKELLVEEYVTDILRTPPEKLVLNIYLPLDGKGGVRAAGQPKGGP